MEDIDKKLNSLSEAEVPMGAHRGVMEKIYNSRLVPVFLAVSILFMISLLFTLWHVNARLIDAEFLDMMQDFFEVFKFDFEFFKTFTINFFETISPVIILSAIFSLVGVIYATRKIFEFKLKK